jgi:hypothetical protein
VTWAVENSFTIADAASPKLHGLITVGIDSARQRSGPLCCSDASTPVPGIGRGPGTERQGAAQGRESGGRFRENAAPGITGVFFAALVFHQ